MPCEQLDGSRSEGQRGGSGRGGFAKGVAIPGDDHGLSALDTRTCVGSQSGRNGNGSGNGGAGGGAAQVKI